jgi:hypothetical protein
MGTGFTMSEHQTAGATFVRCVRVLLVCAVAAVLAGCDRCGDFLPPIKFQAQVCKDDTPRPK